MTLAILYICAEEVFFPTSANPAILTISAPKFLHAETAGQEITVSEQDRNWLLGK